jgi:hypothetical protein
MFSSSAQAASGARPPGCCAASAPTSGAWPVPLAPNVIVSPHMSGDFLGWDTALTGLFRLQLARYRAGEPLANVVDKQLGYVPTR